MPSPRAWGYFDESRLSEFVENTKQADVWNWPTLEVFQARSPENVDRLHESGEIRYLSPSSRQMAKMMLSSPNRKEKVALYRRSVEPSGNVVQALNARRRCDFL